MFYPQPFCSESTDFNGLTVDLMFDHQPEVDTLVDALLGQGGASGLIQKLHVSIPNWKRESLCPLTGRMSSAPVRSREIHVLIPSDGVNNANLHSCLHHGELNSNALYKCNDL